MCLGGPSLSTCSHRNQYQICSCWSRKAEPGQQSLAPQCCCTAGFHEVPDCFKDYIKIDIQKLTVLLTLTGLPACLLCPQRGGACATSAMLTGTRGMKAEISRVSTDKSESPAERREIHCNTLTASADLSTAGGVKNALSYGLSSKYLPLHSEGANTCKFTRLNTVIK